MTALQHVQAMDPRTGTPTGFEVAETTAAEVDQAAERAAAAAPAFGGSSRIDRARWLRAIADALETARPELVPVADQETALGDGRLNGELTRTCFQLRLFAEVVEDGGYVEAVIDHAGDTAMGPRPDLRRMLVPIGPVAVFGASNFPFAFSVPGGDTAAALAAACPVVIKAHPSHPETSQRCFEVLRDALSAAGAPDGVVSLVHGVDAGAAVVRHPAIRAVGFTGSSRGGQALARLAAERPDPIPFYGELSGLNPLVISPGAARARGAEIAEGLVASVMLGAGQFCTKPGLVFLLADAAGDEVLAGMAAALDAAAPPVALDAGIGSAFASGRTELSASNGVSTVAEVAADGSGYRMAPTLLTVPAAELDGRLLEECFGPLAVVVRYADSDELGAALRMVPGSLTASLHIEDDEATLSAAVLPLLAERAGRLVWNGYPTGVAVAWAMQHGGPAPSTTNSLHTSVGPTAIRRFVRPLTFQNAPAAALPAELVDGPASIPRRVDGRLVPATA
ncbi:MAG: aldehyde dehydrogenase (NADP(+)) [Jatrophihabitans sp.]